MYNSQWRCALYLFIRQNNVLLHKAQIAVVFLVKYGHTRQKQEYRYIYDKKSEERKESFVFKSNIDVLVYMRKSEKSMLFVGSKKKPIFILRGTLLKPIVFHFLYFFIEEKILRPFWKIYIFLRVFFHFFILFSFRFILTQSDFAANKRAFKHCTPPIMVSLAFFTIFTPHFWRYFCIFSEFHIVNVFYSSPNL